MNDTCIITIKFNGKITRLFVLNTNKENTGLFVENNTLELYNLYNFNYVYLYKDLYNENSLYCITTNNKTLQLSCNTFSIEYTTSEIAGALLRKGDYIINLNVLAHSFIPVK